MRESELDVMCSRLWQGGRKKSECWGYEKYLQATPDFKTKISLKITECNSDMGMIPRLEIQQGGGRGWKDHPQLRTILNIDNNKKSLM